MINRYKTRTIVKNDKETYSEIFRNRNVKHILQYTSPNFTYINAKQFANLNIVEHVWKEGDRYYKLAEKYYGDPQDWWIIAKFNLKPTESHVTVGDILQIPLPLNKVLEYMKG